MHLFGSQFQVEFYPEGKSKQCEHEAAGYNLSSIRHASSQPRHSIFIQCRLPYPQNNATLNTWGGDLNENGPHKLMCLNIWSWWSSLEGWMLQKSLSFTVSSLPVAWFWRSKSPYHSQVTLCFCFVNWNVGSQLQLHSFPTCYMPWSPPQGS